MITAAAALRRLREGNERFVSARGSRKLSREHARRLELVENQAPFAVLLGCSDSRVPAEIVFDQGLGDLFVIRVAGNIVMPSQIGSVEFAAEKFGTRLVVVLGHSGCGAVIAALEELYRPSGENSPNLGLILDRIRPSVESLVESVSDPDKLLEAAVRANIRDSVERLRNGSKTIETLIREDGLVVTGAEYSLETGMVEFLHEPPASRS